MGILSGLFGESAKPEGGSAPAAQPASTPHSLDISATLAALGARDPSGWGAVLTGPCSRSEINTPARMAAFLANVLHETGKMATLVESLNYAADRLVPVFGTKRITIAQARQYGRTSAHPADQEAIANIVYGGDWGARNLGNTQDGDGWLFRGRGLIQITGRANYTRFSKTIGLPLDELPELLETRDGAASSACQFWKASGCNALADAKDIEAVRRKVNGGLNGMDEVRQFWMTAMALLGEPVA